MTFKWPNLEREMRENFARQMYTPSLFVTQLHRMSDQKATEYRARNATKLSEVLELIRLDYEVGPLLGPSWLHMQIATRGRRAVEDTPGRPGRLAWRVTR